MVTYLTLGKFESNLFITYYSHYDMRCKGVNPKVSPYLTHNYCGRCRVYRLKKEYPGRFCPDCNYPVRHNSRFTKSKDVKRY